MVATLQGGRFTRGDGQGLAPVGAGRGSPGEENRVPFGAPQLKKDLGRLGGVLLNYSAY